MQSQPPVIPHNSRMPQIVPPTGSVSLPMPNSQILDKHSTGVTQSQTIPTSTSDARAIPAMTPEAIQLVTKVQGMVIIHRIDIGHE